jgi:hypothetical protein
MQKLIANLTYWLNPMKWARQFVFLCLLALDYQHTYEFVLSLSSGAQAHEQVPIFGPLLANFGVQITNGVFDAHAYAFTITATIFFMSNTLAKRLAHNHPSWTYYLALGTGVAVSALTNAGTMFYGATNTMLVPAALIGAVAAALGGIITAGLLMFASMDAWDMKARIEKGRATRLHNQQQRVISMQRSKYTPKKYRKPGEEIAA